MACDLLERLLKLSVVNIGQRRGAGAQPEGVLADDVAQARDRLHFAQVAAKLGPMRLAVLPIGAYKPRWFMKS